MKESIFIACDLKVGTMELIKAKGQFSKTESQVSVLSGTSGSLAFLGLMQFQVVLFSNRM